MWPGAPSNLKTALGPRRILWGAARARAPIRLIEKSPCIHQMLALFQQYILVCPILLKHTPVRRSTISGLRSPGPTSFIGLLIVGLRRISLESCDLLSYYM